MTSLCRFNRNLSQFLDTVYSAGFILNSIGILLVNRDIVLASHLKPLDKSDNIGQCFKPTWNVNSLKANSSTKLRSQNTEVCLLTDVQVQCPINVLFITEIIFACLNSF